MVVHAFVLAFALAASGGPAAADDSQRSGIAAVVLMDSSGSMKRTDPARLRVPAAQLFLSLLDADDRAAVVSFSDAGYPIVRLTIADARGRERLVAGTDKVSSKGAHTNLHAAIEQGMSVLDESVIAHQRRYLILLSDGRMDTGDEARDQQLSDKIRDDLLPALRDRNIKVYSIAFTQESDIDLLRTIALASDGLFQLIEDQDQLHNAFADIFESAKAPNMLPMDDGSFEVDDAVRELTVVAVHEPDDDAVVLRDPNGQEWRYKAHPDDVRWMHSPRFELITVPGPAAGKWTLSTGTSGDRAYVVTDLELATDLHQNRVTQGQTLQLRVWLTDQGEPMRQPEVLSNTEFLLELESADGKQRTIALSAPGADGVASAAVPMQEAGPLRLSVIARSATFERQTRHRIHVLPPAAALAQDTPTFIVPPIQLPIPESPDTGAATRPAEPIAERAKQETAAPDVVELDQAAAGDDEPVRFTTVLLVFLLINGVLAILIGGTLLLLKRRHSAARAAQPSED